MAKKLQLKQENKKHKKEGGHRFLEPTFRNDLLTVAYFLYNTFLVVKGKKSVTRRVVQMVRRRRKDHGNPHL
jgi:hypothetical protein